MNPLVVGGQVAASTGYHAKLLRSGRGIQANARADAIAITTRANGVYHQPVIGAGGTILQQHRGLIVAVHDNIHETIVVEVPKSHSASSHRPLYRRAGTRRYIHKMLRYIPHYQRCLKISNLGQLELNVIHYVTLSHKQILHPSLSRSTNFAPQPEWRILADPIPVESET